MGICASELSPAQAAAEQADRAKSRELDGAMANSQGDEQQISKLLLLGAGGSGKSTLFKQMIQIYGNGFGEAERKNFAPVIYNNIILNMKALVENLEKFGQTTGCKDAEQAILAAAEEDEVDEALGAHVRALWADPGIQETYKNASKFQLNDSTIYYMGRLDDISKPDYLPTEQDVLRSRVPTTGIVENSFEIDGNSFKMFDVGGQRSERKKWIHCFENVTAVLFVAAISSYDQVLYEDETTGRMHEALELFEEISNSEWFVNTSMILFLNKRDIFEAKIQHTPLNAYFPEYTGPDEFGPASEFIQDMFQAKNHVKDKDVYPHLTCATDKDNIQKVFTFVKDIVIKRGLNLAGLM